MLSAELITGGICTPVDGVLRGWARLQLVLDWAAGAGAVLGAAAAGADETALATLDAAVATEVLLAAVAGALDEGTELEAPVTAEDEEDEAAAAGVLTDWASTWDKMHSKNNGTKRMVNEVDKR